MPRSSFPPCETIFFLSYNDRGWFKQAAKKKYSTDAFKTLRIMNKAGTKFYTNFLDYIRKRKRRENGKKFRRVSFSFDFVSL